MSAAPSPPPLPADFGGDQPAGAYAAADADLDALDDLEDAASLAVQLRLNAAATPTPPPRLSSHSLKTADVEALAARPRHVPPTPLPTPRQRRCVGKTPGPATPTPVASPPCHPPNLHIDRPTDLLRHITSSLHHRLAASDIACMTAYLEHLRNGDEQLTVGTACSGSDCIHDGLSAIDDVLFSDTHSARPFFTQHFGCELDAEKRRFIRLSKPGISCMFTNVTCLRHDTALNAFAPSGATAATPVRPVFLFLAGFSCKDLSSLNPQSGGFKSACANGTGRTGSTYAACMDYIRKHRPSVCVLENVKKLASPDPSTGMSNLDHILLDFKRADYRAIALMLCPRQLGLAVTRARIIIVASRILSLAALESLAMLVDLQKAHTDPSRRFPLSMFLVTADSPLIDEYYADLQDDRRSSACKKQRTLGPLRQTHACPYPWVHVSAL